VVNNFLSISWLITLPILGSLSLLFLKSNSKFFIKNVKLISVIVSFVTFLF
jgi:hypothetical protein